MPGPRRRSPAFILTAAQQELVVRNIGLVGVHLRNRVHIPRQPWRRRERADLFQVGCLALVRAAGRYDAARDGAFAPFALQRIRGAVFTAIYEHFATIRVPVKVVVGARREAAVHGRGSRPRLPVVRQFTETETSSMAASRCQYSRSPGEPTIRECVRLRFQRAVTAAIDGLRSHKWKRADAGEIIAAVASDRLLMSPDDDRVTVRELAARLHVSCGRIGEYERMLREAVKHHLACDPQLPRLLAFAREDRCGMDGPLTADRREMLISEEQQALSLRLRSMAHGERTELLYRLICDSGAKPDDVILNLHRLSVWRELPAAAAE